ncbi:RHS repeat-associated core domain-containing protein [Pseudomonas triticifolii]|uniref:RHS repeat-associated core domain-containing protein n=1 Tax=Pseudomonas triticifolii TaxID=2762592 RepID=A0ABR7BEC8_9PSED|nr:RHS repeat-associated core domain-containing protein [Pseudomonas triticifolii]MBC3955534.1 RHS repeat-associated core domain-containing protein [Pseudomonas triticifolii]
MKFKTDDPEAVLCAYRYDALDRLISSIESGNICQRFYLENRLVNEVGSEFLRTVVRYEDFLLAERSRDQGGTQIAHLLTTTDGQNSVLHTQFELRSAALSYTPYGHHDSSINQGGLLRFAGERPDGVTGHYLLGNGYRAFNPVLMRFNNPDSLSPFDEGGLNAYVYCGADPVNRIDPDGHIYSSIVLNAASRFLRLIGRSPRSAALAPRLTRKAPALVKAGRNPERLIAHVDESPPLKALPEERLAVTPRERHVLEGSTQELLTHHRRYAKSTKQMLSEKRKALRREAVERNPTQDFSIFGAKDSSRSLSRFEILQSRIAQERRQAGRTASESLLGGAYGIRSNSSNWQPIMPRPV